MRFRETRISPHPSKHCSRYDRPSYTFDWLATFDLELTVHRRIRVLLAQMPALRQSLKTKGRNTFRRGQKIMKETPPKIAELVAAAKAELTRLGINIEGKRSDELLNMVRAERNHPKTSRLKDESPQVIKDDFAP